MSTSATGDTGRATYARLASSRGFPALVGIQLAMVLGASLQMFALSVLVYARTGSPFWSSAAFAAGFLPQLIGGALLTSLADRWPTRPLIAAGTALRAATAALLAIADLPPIMAITVVASVAVFAPVPSAAQAALVARMLTGDLYVLGRSTFSIVSSGAQLMGLAVGGTVVAGLGPRAAIAAAGGVQLAGLLAVPALPAIGRTTTTVGRWRIGETWTGNAALLRDRIVRRVLLSWWLPSLLLVGAEALVVAYVGEQGESATSTGVLLAAFPAGAALGDVVIGRWLAATWQRRSVPWLLTLVGVGLPPFAWDPPTVVGALCFAAVSAGTAYQLGGQQTFLAAVPTSRQGLAFGLSATGVMTAQGIGPVLSGALANTVGAGATITLLGAGILLVTLFLGRLPDVTPAASNRSPLDSQADVATDG